MWRPVMIDQIRQFQNQIKIAPEKEPVLIDLQDIKAILYMGLRGRVSLPVNPDKHKVDILV